MSKKQKPTREDIKRIEESVTFTNDGGFWKDVINDAQKIVNKREMVKPKYGIPPKLPRK